MIAAHTVCLNQNKTKVVKEGDKDAQFTLVKKGTEISDAQLDKYPGAREMAGGKKASHADEGEPAKAAHAPTKETPKSDRGTVKHRDPRSR